MVNFGGRWSKRSKARDEPRGRMSLNLCWAGALCPGALLFCRSDRGRARTCTPQLRRQMLSLRARSTTFSPGLSFPKSLAGLCKATKTTSHTRRVSKRGYPADTATRPHPTPDLSMVEFVEELAPMRLSQKGFKWDSRAGWGPVRAMSGAAVRVTAPTTENGTVADRR
jgi:hypothetical protein